MNNIEEVNNKLHMQLEFLKYLENIENEEFVRKLLLLLANTQIISYNYNNIDDKDRSISDIIKSFEDFESASETMIASISSKLPKII